MKNMNKKYVLIGAAVVLGILILGAAGFFILQATKKSSQQPVVEQPARRKISEPVNEISVAERPYLKLIPKADGRNIEIQAVEIKKPATTMEFELEYQAGTLLQGAFGQLEIGSLPASTQIMFGSCSAGGACTYHTDIKSGTLLARFEGEDKYAVKQDWRYFDNAKRETSIASKDAKFQLESKSLAAVRFGIVYNTPGFPGEASDLGGNVVSEIYSLTASSALTGTGTLSIRASEEGALTIIGYNGSSWKKFDTTVDGKTATAAVELMEAYAVVRE